MPIPRFSATHTSHVPHMPDSTKDRLGDLAPTLVNGYSAGTGAGTGTGHHPMDITPSSSLKRLSSHLQHHTRQDPSPLSLALPLSIRSHGHSNGSNSFATGPLSAGYLEHRRDTFHSLSHPPTTSFQYLNGNSNVNNVSSIAYDDHQPPPPLHHRPLSLSYASLQHPHHQYQHQQQQHTSSSSSLDPEGLLRRRRLSTASSSSKQRLGSAANLRSKAHNTPHHTRRFTTLISDQEPDTTYLWGYLLFLSTMIGFTVSMYALVASNYMPTTGNKTLDWIKQDSHYCMLVPVTIPVTVLAVLFNWLGMKLFRHN